MFNHHCYSYNIVLV